MKKKEKTREELEKEIEELKKEKAINLKGEVGTHEEEEKEKTIVLNEIPKEPMRKVRTEEGELINIIDRDEALTEILEKIREIHKTIQ